MLAGRPVVVGWRMASCFPQLGGHPFALDTIWWPSSSCSGSVSLVPSLRPVLAQPLQWRSPWLTVCHAVYPFWSRHVFRYRCFIMRWQLLLIPNSLLRFGNSSSTSSKFRHHYTNWLSGHFGSSYCPALVGCAPRIYLHSVDAGSLSGSPDLGQLLFWFDRGARLFVHLKTQVRSGCCLCFWGDCMSWTCLQLVVYSHSFSSWPLL